MEKGAISTNSVVSFALPLTDSDAAICRVPVGGTLTPCGDPAAVPTAQAMAAPASAAVTAVVAPTAIPQTTPGPAGPAVRGVALIPKITGATALSAFTGALRGVPQGTQIVGLYMAGSSVNQLERVPTTDLPRVSGTYTLSGDAGYQYLDKSGALGRLMPTMSANLRPVAPSVRNAWDGGIVVFSDGSVGRMLKAANGDGSEKDYVYFSILNGVNANQGMAIVSGTAAAGQSVEVRLAGNVLATVRADASGNWNFAGAASLAGAGQALTVAIKP